MMKTAAAVTSSSSSSPMSAIRSGFVVALFVISMVLHLHLKVVKHFSDAHPPCVHGLIDFPSPSSSEQQQQTATIKTQRQLLASSSSGNQLSTGSSAAAFQQAQQQQQTGEEGVGVGVGGLHRPNSKVLPVENDNGIIIFYMHIPKTGGTTMMAPFVKHPDWRYRMVYGFGKQTRYRKEMYDWLENWEKGTKVYYEYHAGTASPYMDSQVREDLLVWKAMAKVRNIPFFAFTVVREPLSMAVSHFNFYYSGKTNDPRYFWFPDPTEKDFIEIGVPNPQCLFCIKSEVAYYQDWRKKGKSIHSTPAACDNVYDAFVNDFDWIGTTEKLSVETFPILEQLGNVRYCPEVRNKSKDKISKRTLSQEALDHVRNTTVLDQSIYDRVQRDFPLSMWSNYDTTPRKPPINRHNRCKYKTGQALPPGELPKRPGERRRFLEKNPDFVEVKGAADDHKHLRPHYLDKY